MRSMRAPLLLVLAAAIMPAPAEAQFGKLKKAIQQKAAPITGEARSGDVPPDENGLVAKLYPGAVPGGASHPDVDAYGYTLLFYSKDEPEKVRAFYEELYGELEAEPELHGTRENLTMQGTLRESSWGIAIMDGITVLELLGQEPGEGDNPPDQGVGVFSVRPDGAYRPAEVDPLVSPLAMWVGAGHRSDAELREAAKRFAHLHEAYFLPEPGAPAAGAGARLLEACHQQVLPHHAASRAGGGAAPVDPQKQQQLTQQMIAAYQAGRTEEAEKIQRQLEAMGAAMGGQSASVEGQVEELENPRWDEWLACLESMDAAAYRTRIEIAPYPKPES